MADDGDPRWVEAPFPGAADDFGNRGAAVVELGRKTGEVAGAVTDAGDGIALEGQPGDGAVGFRAVAPRVAMNPYDQWHRSLAASREGDVEALADTGIGLSVGLVAEGEAGPSAGVVARIARGCFPVGLGGLGGLGGTVGLHRQSPLGRQSPPARAPLRPPRPAPACARLDLRRGLRRRPRILEPTAIPYFKRVGLLKARFGPPCVKFGPLCAGGISRWQPGSANKERGDHERLQAPRQQTSRAAAARALRLAGRDVHESDQHTSGELARGNRAGPRRPACAAFSGSAHRGSLSRKAG